MSIWKLGRQVEYKVRRPRELERYYLWGARMRHTHCNFCSSALVEGGLYFYQTSSGAICGSCIDRACDQLASSLKWSRLELPNKKGEPPYVLIREKVESVGIFALFCTACGSSSDGLEVLVRSGSGSVCNYCLARSLSHQVKDAHVSAAISTIVKAGQDLHEEGRSATTTRQSAFFFKKALDLFCSAGDFRSASKSALNSGIVLDNQDSLVSFTKALMYSSCSLNHEIIARSLLYLAVLRVADASRELADLICSTEEDRQWQLKRNIVDYLFSFNRAIELMVEADIGEEFRNSLARSLFEAACFMLDCLTAVDFPAAQKLIFKNMKPLEERLDDELLLMMRDLCIADQNILRDLIPEALVVYENVVTKLKSLGEGLRLGEFFSSDGESADEIDALLATLRSRYGQLAKASAMLSAIEQSETSQAKGALFEEIAKEVFKALGFTLRDHRDIEVGGEIFKVDVIANDHVAEPSYWRGDTVIECKFWSRPVGRDEVLKLIYIKSHSSYSEFVLLHEGKVTSGAATLAAENGIGLIDIYELIATCRKALALKTEALKHSTRRLLTKHRMESNIRRVFARSSPREA